MLTACYDRVQPTGGSTWDDDNYKDDETFGFDDPKQQTGLEKEEEEKRRRGEFEEVSCLYGKFGVVC